MTVTGPGPTATENPLAALDAADGLDLGSLRSRVTAVCRAVERGEVPPAELWAVGAMHPNADVRLQVVRAALDHPHDEEAGQLLSWAIRDVDDRVAIVALRGKTQGASIDDVFDAAGRSLAALDGEHYGGCDLRRRAVNERLLSLLREHDDPDAERQRLSWTGYDPDQSLSERRVDIAGTVRIDAGKGVRFPFYIERHPVTVGQYEQFLRAVEETGPAWSHPGQPANHDHDVLRYLTSEQRRRLRDHPVTGVCWYDAWAYAAWCGMKLPTVAQWELAARADTGPYPWGAAPAAADRANVDSGASDPLDRMLLDWPDTVGTTEVMAHPRGASPAGVHDLLGNVWEWTRSRFLDEQDILPYVGPVPDVIGDWTVMACVKGGSWATRAHDVNSATRAEKHVLQRGLETGFRCVVEPLGE